MIIIWSIMNIEMDNEMIINDENNNEDNSIILMKIW